VGGSGLIFAAIFVAWALILVPHWLRRRGEDSREAGSGLGLARRLPWRTNKSPHAGSAARSNASAGALQDRSGARRNTRASAALEAVTGDAGHANAARRRRRVLGVLLLANLLMGVLVVAGGALELPLVTPILMAVPLGALAGYLALLVLSAPGRRKARDARARLVPQRTAPDVEADPTATASDRLSAPGLRVDELPTDAEAGHRLAEEGAIASDEREAEPILPPASPAPTVVAQVTMQAEHGEPWTPVPVPLPAYVNSVRPASSVRTIDLSFDGPWATSPVDGPADQEPIHSDAGHGAASQAVLAESSLDEAPSRLGPPPSPGSLADRRAG
jgi:hypothetical protein